MEFDFKLLGVEELKRALDKWEDEVIDELVRRQDENGEDLLQKSQALVPKLSGDLEGSGTKDDVKVNPYTREISVEVGYNMHYAARQHEESRKPGPITRGKPGVDGMRAGNKYLERPLKFYANKYLQNLIDGIRKTTGGF